MKNTLILLLFCLFAFSSFAQKDSATIAPRDRIYLKSGFVIMGVITEKDSTGTIKLESGHREFSYRADEIKKIEKEKPVKPPRPQIYGFKKMGYTGILECGYTYMIPTSQSNSASMFSLHFINSYQESPLFTVGFGFGTEISNRELYMLPFFADFRLNFTRKHNSPFLELAIGYNGVISNVTISDGQGDYFSRYHFFSGFMVSPSLGWRVRLNPKTALVFSLSYKYYDTNISLNYAQYNGNYFGTDYYTLYTWYSYLKSQAVSFKVGLQF
jgi:hypothetical protein